METFAHRPPSQAIFLGTVVLSVLLSVALCQKAQSAPPPAALASAAARAPEPRTLAVQGQAEIGTTPDEVTIVVRVDSFHVSLRKAKRDNDQRAQALLARLPGLGVRPKDVQTESFYISPRYEGPPEKRTLAGYDVSKRITLSIDDVEKADALLSELFEGEANALERVSFSPSKIAEKQAEARLLAVKAARQKAEGQARELGQRLGHPLKVDDTSNGYLAARGLANISYNNESAPAAGPTLAAGKTHVQASVSVLFELLDP